MCAGSNTVNTANPRMSVLQTIYEVGSTDDDSDALGALAMDGDRGENDESTDMSARSSEDEGDSGRSDIDEG